MPSPAIRIIGAAIALLMAPATGSSQGLVPRAQPVSPMAEPGGPPVMVYPAERMAMVDPDKKLSAGDQITLEIVEDRVGGLPRVVTATGELDVDHLFRVRVAGKTAAEAAATIKELLERDYYYVATVRLAIDQVSKVQVQQGTVLISGSVRRSGTQVIIAGEPLTVTGAILKAAPTEWADLRKVMVFRQNKDGTSERIQVDVKKITETGDAKSDPMLQDGDRINVPRKFINF